MKTLLDNIILFFSLTSSSTTSTIYIKANKIRQHARGSNQILLKYNSDNILNHFNHVCDNNEEYKKILLNLIFKSLDKYVIEYTANRTISKQFSNINAAVFKVFNKTNDQKMNKNRNMFAAIFGYKIFPSNLKIKQTLNILKPKSEEFVKIGLAPKEGKTKHKATAYVFNDLEAVAQNCDAYFNNNKFKYIDVISKGQPRLFVSFGADKSTDKVISVYLQSFACIGGYKTGVNESTANCFVYGNFQDDNFHLTDLYQKTSKRETIEILTRKPALITLCIANTKDDSYFFSSGIFHYDRKAHYEKNNARNDDEMQQILIQKWKNNFKKLEQTYQHKYKQKLSELDDKEELEMKINRPHQTFGLDSIEHHRKGRVKKTVNSNSTWQKSLKNGINLCNQWKIPSHMLPIRGVSQNFAANNNKKNTNLNDKNNKNDKDIDKNTEEKENNNKKTDKMEIDDSDDDESIDNNANNIENNENIDNNVDSIAKEPTVFNCIENLINRSNDNNRTDLPYLDEFKLSQSYVLYFIYVYIYIYI